MGFSYENAVKFTFKVSSYFLRFLVYEIQYTAICVKGIWNLLMNL